MAELEKQREKIEAQLEAQIVKLQAAEEFKQLISGTGSGFAAAVSKALEELGFRLTDGPQSRADLIGSCNDRYVAIEAKGIEGPVKERQYRQVERWIAELSDAVHSDLEDIKGDADIARYAECVSAVALSDYDGGDVKGLLIVATFRRTPLDERSEPDFPDMVVRLLERSDICAMTGLQLFGLVMEARNTSLKLELRNEILTTRGVFSRGKDWTVYLTKIPSSNTA